MEVDCWIKLVELIPTVVWLTFRDLQSRSYICENFLTLRNFKAGKSTSRLKYVLKQQILISQRTGSKKLRWQSQLMNLRHLDRLWGETIFPDYDMLDAMIASALEGLLGGHVHFRGGRVSWGGVLRILADSYVEEKLLTWSTSISVQPELMKRWKDSHICSLSVCRMTTSKTSTFDGIKLYYQLATRPRKWSDFSSQNYRTLFSFRLFWLCTTL